MKKKANKEEICKNTEDLNLCKDCYGLVINPKAQELRKRLTEEEIEIIFKECFCWYYECGALIAAMRYKGYSDDHILDVISVIELMVYLCDPKEIKSAYEEFLQKYMPKKNRKANSGKNGSSLTEDFEF